MNYSNYRITLDVRNTVANVQLTAKKGDAGRKIYITLSDKGKPCEIADDSYAVFAGVKPDGTLLYNRTTIEDNTIIYDMTQQTTAVAGLVACEVKLFDSMSNLLTSPKLTILVDDVVVPDEEIVSMDEVTALTELILDASATRELAIKATEECNAATETANTATQNANDAAGNATTAAEAANSAKDSANNAAGNAASQANAATAAATTANNAASAANLAADAANEAATNANNAAVETLAAIEDIENAYGVFREVDLTAGGYSCIITTSNKWSTSTTRKSWINTIPDGALKLTVKAHSINGSTIAFLKDNTHNAGEAPNYAEDTSRIGIVAGVSKTFEVPVDAKFIYIQNYVGETVYAPESAIYFMGYKEIPEIDTTLSVGGKVADSKIVGDYIRFLEETLFTPKLVNWETVGWCKGFITTNNVWVTATDQLTYFVKVENSAKKFTVTSNADNVSIIGFLTSNSHVRNETPHYVEGTGRTTIPAGETAEFIIPTGCTHIAVCVTYDGAEANKYLPASCYLHEYSVEATSIPLGLHTMPKNNGVLNVIKRCRQLTDIKWTPKFDIPRKSALEGVGDGRSFEDVFKAGVEYTGIPYSRANISSAKYGYENFFVGFDIDIDTFMTAVRNENSPVAIESKYSEGNNRASFYGCVCSALASYAYNLPSYRETVNLPSASGMNLIGKLWNEDGTSLDANLIELGDMVIYAGNHVIVVTDLIKDENGNTIYIEESEATTVGNADWDTKGSQYGGVCRRVGFTVEEFYQKFKSYSVYRYSKISSVPYTPSKFVNVGDELKMACHADMPCIPYMGNGFKYKVGYIYNSDLLIKSSGFTHVRVLKDGEPWNSDGTTNYYEITGEKITLGFTEQGEYSAYLCIVEGEVEKVESKHCYWSVT